MVRHSQNKKYVDVTFSFVPLIKTILKIRTYNELSNIELNKYHKKITDKYTDDLRKEKKSIELPNIDDVIKSILG